MEDGLNALAFRFFVEFARLEYALKASGFLTAANGTAEANWSRFAREIEAEFWRKQAENAALSLAVEEFKNALPRKQIVVDSVLMWSDAPVQTGSDLDDLLVYVRRVRNNLFHGGKFGGRWLAPERASFLLPRSLQILQATRECSGPVTDAYDHGALPD